MTTIPKVATFNTQNALTAVTPRSGDVVLGETRRVRRFYALLVAAYEQGKLHIESEIARKGSSINLDKLLMLILKLKSLQ